MTRTMQPILAITLIITIALQLAVVYSAWVASPVVWQVEAELGRTLDCETAYGNREINDFFYPDRHLLGDILYGSSMFGILWAVVVVTFVVMAAAEMPQMRPFSRINTALLRGILLLVVPLLIYLPVIGKVTCATE